MFYGEFSSELDPTLNSSFNPIAILSAIGLRPTHPQHKHLGPVVQSIISLTSSLRGQLIKGFATL